MPKLCDNQYGSAANSNHQTQAAAAAAVATATAATARKRAKRVLDSLRPDYPRRFEYQRTLLLGGEWPIHKGKALTA